MDTKGSGKVSNKSASKSKDKIDHETYCSMSMRHTPYCALEKKQNNKIHNNKVHFQTNKIPDTLANYVYISFSKIHRDMVNFSAMCGVSWKKTYK